MVIKTSDGKVSIDSYNDYIEKMDAMKAEIDELLGVQDDGTIIETETNRLSSELHSYEIIFSAIAKANTEILVYTPDVAEKIFKEMDDVLQIARFLNTEAAKSESSLTQAEIVQNSKFQKPRLDRLKNEYNITLVNNSSFKDMESRLRDNGIPYSKLVTSRQFILDNSGEIKRNRDGSPQYRAVSAIVTPRFFKEQMNKITRLVNVENQRGEISDKKMLGEFLNKIEGLNLVQLEFYKKYATENGLAFVVETSDEDKQNPKFNVVFNAPDANQHTKAFYKALLSEAHLIDQKADLIYENIIKADFEEKQNFKKAIVESEVADRYICSDSFDSFIKLTKDGMEVYEDGKLIPGSKISRDDPNFQYELISRSTPIRDQGMKVISASDLLGKNIDMTDFNQRKELLSKMKTSRLSFITFDENFMKQLKRFKTMEQEPKMTQERLNEIKQEKGEDSPEYKKALAKFNRKGVKTSQKNLDEIKRTHGPESEEYKNAVEEAVKYAEEEVMLNVKDFDKTDIFANSVMNLLANVFDDNGYLFEENSDFTISDVLGGSNAPGGYGENNVPNIYDVIEIYAEHAREYAQTLDAQRKYDLYVSNPEEFSEKYPNELAPTEEAVNKQIQALSEMKRTRDLKFEELCDQYHVGIHERSMFKAALKNECGYELNETAGIFKESEDLKKVNAYCSSLDNVLKKIDTISREARVKTPVQAHTLDRKIAEKSEIEHNFNKEDKTRGASGPMRE